MKLERKTLKQHEAKLEGWTVEQTVDEPAMFAPHIPEMLEKTNWSEWEEQFTWRPRKSIYGKTIWGKVQHRHEMNAWSKVPLAGGVKQWATSKEVFESKLRGDRDKVDVAGSDEYYKRTTANG